MTLKISSVLLILSSFFFVACATDPNKVEKIDTKLENKQDVGGGQTLGVDDKGDLVVQKQFSGISRL